jgi:hypothetical protein
MNAFSDYSLVDGTKKHPNISTQKPLVESPAAGVLGMKGVGEEPPLELENILPGYEIWPHGYTLDPMDQLSSFSTRERANYIRGAVAGGWLAFLNGQSHNPGGGQRDWPLLRSFCLSESRPSTTIMPASVSAVC